MSIYNITMVVKMNILISNSSGQPIYEQIVSQIKALVISGELNEGDTLPSMRLLAKELRISVITTKRAYDELEREGFIISVTGKGSFVASKNVELIKEQQLKEIEAHMQAIAGLAASSGIELSQLIEMMTLIFEGE
jgi:GntR family transcriptional regulator